MIQCEDEEICEYNLLHIINTCVDMSVWWERIIFITTFLSDHSSSHDADDCYYCDERFWLMVTGQSDRDSTAPVKITNILQHIQCCSLLTPWELSNIWLNFSFPGIKDHKLCVNVDKNILEVTTLTRS